METQRRTAAIQVAIAGLTAVRATTAADPRIRSRRVFISLVKFPGGVLVLVLLLLARRADRRRDARDGTRGEALVEGGGADGQVLLLLLEAALVGLGELGAAEAGVVVVIGAFRHEVVVVLVVAGTAER
ncbi:hypothetical protein PG997_012029 [Apiospora hydei]|uniref:Uncharacterized protein n=1 Tax=Apiospora hydei TaxID=1337664 RepID=A0ABR1V262_9PEZI